MDNIENNFTYFTESLLMCFLFFSLVVIVVQLSTANAMFTYKVPIKNSK